MKATLKKTDSGSLETKLACIYRLTPHSITEVRPAKLLVGRQLRWTCSDRHVFDMWNAVSKDRFDDTTSRPELIIFFSFLFIFSIIIPQKAWTIHGEW